MLEWQQVTIMIADKGFSLEQFQLFFFKNVGMEMYTFIQLF